MRMGFDSKFLPSSMLKSESKYGSGDFSQRFSSLMLPSQHAGTVARTTQEAAAGRC